MQKAVKITNYINPETGEVHDVSSFVDMQFDDNGYLFWAKKSNVRTFLEVPLPDTFTWAERGRIEALRHYILKDNQLLVYRSHGSIRPLSELEISNILQMSHRQCRILINKMVDNHIIKSVRISGITYYAFNPLYGVKDKRLSIQVFIIFQEELQLVLPQWVILKFVAQAEELKPMIEILK
jgi:hypothetical protein